MITNAQVPKRERLNFVLYVLSRFFVTAGNHIYLFAVSYFILYETGSAFYFSINLAISTLVYLLLLPFTGIMSDLGNKRHIILIGEWLYALVLFGLFIYSSMYGISLVAIYVVTFLTSLVSPFVMNAFQAAMTEMFHQDRIQQVMGYVQTFISAVPILGPVLGGMLFGLFSFHWIVCIFMIAAIISAFVNFFIKFDLHYDASDYNEEAPEIEGVFNRFKHDVSQGFIFFFKNETFRSVLIVVSLVNLFVGPISVFPEKMMIVELNFDPKLVGLISGIGGVGMLISGLIIANMKNFKSPLKPVKYGLIILGGLFIIFSLPIYINISQWMSFFYIALVLIMISATLQFINIPSSIFFQKCIPQYIKGRALSAFTMFAIVLSPIGTIAYGILYDQGMYWLINGVSGIILIIIVVSLMRKKVIETAESLNRKVDADMKQKELEEEATT